MKTQTKFPALKELFSTLHSVRGCLWDKKQTHKSLLPYLKEEVNEFIEAVRKNDLHHMKEELGDILLQVMFHSQIASKRGAFDVEDVITELIRKLKRRHPHVFGTIKVKSAKEIIINWHRIKAQERKQEDKSKRKVRADI